MGRFDIEDIVFLPLIALLVVGIVAGLAFEIASKAKETRAHRVEQAGGNEHPTITLENGVVVALGAPAIEEALSGDEEVIRYVGNGMILMNGHLFTTSSWDSRAKDHIRDACPACLEEESECDRRPRTTRHHG